MGLFSALNPFSTGKKHQAAWNALMASYTFLNLDAPRQQLVLSRASDIVENQMRKTLDDVREKNGRVIFLNIIVYALGEEGIEPALGNEKWFWIKNPFVECIGAEEVIEEQRAQLERKYGVRIDIDF
ncbi:MAG: hypothetical protein HYY78_15355 [Betaproteobacteria bacterium]|nr:hypothetical protein [Betaproteobacteria bacterium]